MPLERQGGRSGEAGNSTTPTATEATCAAKARGTVGFLGGPLCPIPQAFSKCGCRGTTTIAGTGNAKGPVNASR